MLEHADKNRINVSILTSESPKCVSMRLECIDGRETNDVNRPIVLVDSSFK